MSKTMRRLPLVFVLLLLLLLSAAVSAQAAMEHQTEIPEGYSAVRTKDDLYEVRSNPSGKYIQMADIEFTEADFAEGGDFNNIGLGWEPIGTQSTPFTGTYDGNGYVIRGLRNAATTDYQGLFGYAKGATLQNIRLEDAHFGGSNYVGGIVGYSYNSTISESTADVVITATGDNVGGIAGYAQLLDNGLKQLGVSGDITGQGYIGGIVGYATNGYNSNGSFTSCTISQVKNSASVSGTVNVGGICGYQTSRTVKYTSASGAYRYATQSIVLQNGYNTGNIYGIESVGGIVGQQKIAENAESNSARILKTYSVGSVSASSSFGGIVGSGSNVSFCYYLASGVTNPTNIGGTPKDNGGLKRQGTYEQWDFNTIWTMYGDVDYPYAELRCMPIQRQSLANASVTVEDSEYTYTGAAITPEPVVALGDKTLQKDIDYTVSYEDNVLEGVATVIVTGIEGYKDTAKTTFLISGHIYGDWITEEPATCTEPGLKYKLCSGCGDRIEETIPALGHNYPNSWSTEKPATCTEPGMKYKLCSCCSDRIEESIPALGHDYKATVIPPTIGEKGYTLHTCSRCGDSYKDTWTGQVPCTISMNCCTATITIGEFKNSVIYTAAYSPAGQMLEIASIPTRSDQKEYQYTFESIKDAGRIKVFYLDGDTMVPLTETAAFSHMPGTGHSYTSKVVKTATCQSEGLVEYRCIYGDHTYTETTPKTGHTSVAIPAVAADCIHSGLTEGSKCSVCGTILKSQQTIPAKGHSWKEADCTHPKTCTVCGKTEGSALGHDYVNGVCTRCGAADPTAVTNITLNKSSLSLTVGASETLRATITPSTAAGAAITWTSSDNSIATVSGGTVKAISEGTATIKASVGGKSATCVMTVTGAASNEAYDYLWNYIVTYGTSNGAGGYYYTKTNNNIKYTYSVIPSSGTIRCSTYVQSSNTGWSSSSIDLVKGASTLDGIYSSASGSASVFAGYTIQPSTFTRETTPTERSFSCNGGLSITDSLKQTVEELFSSEVYLCLLNMDISILKPVGYEIANLGFLCMI